VPTFDLKDYEKLDDWLKQGLADGVRRGLVSAGFRLLGVLQNEIIPQLKPPPIFQGAYRAAWRVITVEDGAEIVNDMPYASVIEYGARAENIKPGRKMIDALTEWVRVKGLTGHAPGERSSPDATTQARSIAWAIARSMQTKGIFNRDGQEGLRVAEKAALKGREFVEEEVRQEVRRTLKK
jgi:hypothetical protein